MRLLRLFLIVAAISGAGAACAKARANIEPAMPVLAPPPPPPRVVETYVDPVPTIEPSPVETALAAPPVRPPARPAAPRTETSKPEPARTEPEKPVPGAPALTLKPPPGMEAKTQASIRGLLDRAMRDLQQVKYAALDADGRAQYDIARGFMHQAEDATKNGNLAFAGKLAIKAATMAAVLVR